MHTNSTDPSASKHYHMGLCFAAIVCLAACVRLLAISGLQGHDDRNYIAYAWKLATEAQLPLDYPTQWLGRLGVLGPLALSIKAFGLNAFGIAAYSFACSMAGFFLLWKLGELWFCSQVRLLAATFLALFPLDVIYATHAYPDAPMGLWMVFTLYCFLRGEKSERRCKLWFLATGISAGIAYLHREDAIYLAGPFLLYVGHRRYIRRGYAWIVIGGLLIVAAEAAIWQAIARDPLFRVHALRARHTDKQEIWKSRSDQRDLTWLIDAYVTAKPDSRTGDNLIEPVAMLGTNQEFGLFYFFIAPIVAWTLWRKQKGLSLAVWIVAIGLLIAYFPIGFPKPMARSPRYYCSLSVPGLLLLAYWIYGQRRSVRLAVVSLLLCSSVACLALDSSRAALDQERLVDAYIKRKPDDTFWLTAKARFHIFYLNGGNEHPRLNVHLLQENRESHAFQAVQLVCPEVEVAESPQDVQSGFVVTADNPRRHSKESSFGPGWTLVQTFRPQRSTIIELAVRGLKTLGVSKRLTSRLGSSEGVTMKVWRVESVSTPTQAEPNRSPAQHK